MRKPLQSRIITAILVTFSAVALFFGAVFLGLLRSHTDALVDKSRALLEMLLEREETSLANEIFEGRHRAIALRVREILALDSILSVTVYDRNGDPLSHMDRLDGASAPLTSEPATPRTRPETWRGLRALAFEAPVSAMGDPIGFVRIRYSMADAERYKRLSLLALAMLLLTTLLVMILILNRLLNIGVRRPIEGLRAAMNRIETDGPGVVVDLDRDDEIGDLTRSFNAMSVQLADLLEKRRVEVHKRKAAQEMLDSIIRSIPDILYRLDPEGKITFINDAVGRYGYRPEELIGTDIIDIVHPEDRAAIERALKERRSGRRKTRDLTLRFLSKEQCVGVFATRSASIVKSNIMLVDAEGLYEGDAPSPDTFKGTQGIARDITRLKDLEDRLRQAQKMEAIGTLAGGIAHDFNNILGGIIGYSELAIGALPADAEKLRIYMERVLSSGRRAGDLVRQILQFARRGETVFAPIDIGPVLKETLKLMDATLPRTIAIETSLTSDPCTIMGDPTQIHQVLMNLCTNAYHAMRETGGTLAVAMESVDLSEARQILAAPLPPGRYVRITVADTGPGISQEIMERIFEPYFTTKKMNEGTGLGLSVSLGIVESHGGAIEAASAPGEGTVFTVFLPVTEPSAMPEATASRPLPKGDGERILLVDDEPFFLDAVCDQLESLGYVVETHHNGLEALVKLRIDPTGFDLLVTDQTMPEITGVQLAGKVRALNPDLPILLCTGYSETVTEETASRFGISKFLMKPLNREDLAFAVHKLLNRAGGG